MVPFVLSINPNIESICFDDRLKDEMVTYVRDSHERDFVENLTDGIIYKTKVHRTKNTNVGKDDKDYYIYCIISNEETDDEPKRSKVIVTLPITEDEDGVLRVIRFDKTLPQVYIYLPLLGCGQTYLSVH